MSLVFSGDGSIIVKLLADNAHFSTVRQSRIIQKESYYAGGKFISILLDDLALCFLQHQ
jgi:hypothetical protein